MSIHIFSFKILFLVLFFLSAFRRLPIPNAPTWSSRRFLLYKFISSRRDGYPLAVVNGYIPVSQPNLALSFWFSQPLAGAPVLHATALRYNDRGLIVTYTMAWIFTCPLIRSGYLISLISCTNSLDLFFIPTLLCNARYYTSLPWSSPED